MKLYKLMLISLLVLLCFSSAVSASDSNSTYLGANDASRPEATFADLQTAIDNAGAGSSLYLNGTHYKGEQVITINKNLIIYGHSKGSSLSSIIDGQEKTNLIVVSGAVKVYFVNIDFVNGIPPRDNTQGGAIYAANANSLVSVQYCNFVNNRVNSGNSAGGAICSAGSFSAHYCDFINCTAWEGGAISTSGSGKLTTVTNSYFSGCEASMGGTIAANGIYLANSTIVNGKCGHYGAAVYANYLYGLDNCLFMNNTAESYGGAIYFKGFNNAYYPFRNCAFINNSGYWGGAIYGYLSGSNYFEFDNFLFVNNSACSVSESVPYVGGGAIFIMTPSRNVQGTITNSLFFTNNARNGGAISEGTTSPSCTVTLNIVNCTFIRNDAIGNGGAINLGSRANANIENSVFYNNTANNGSHVYATAQTVADGNWWGNNSVNGVEGFEVSNWLIVALSNEKNQITLEFKVKDENGEYDYNDELPARGFILSANKGSLSLTEGAIQNNVTSTLSTEGAGNYIVTAKVDNQILYLSSYVPKVELTSNSPVTLGEDVILTATTTYEGNPVTGQIEFYDGEGNLIATVDMDDAGKASITLKDYEIGVYSNYSAKFTSNDIYLSSESDKINFTVEKADSILEISLDDVVYNRNITGNVTLTSRGNPIDGTVNIMINGKTFSVDVVNGHASFDIANELSVGENTIIASFAGNDICKPVSVNKTIDVLKANATVSVAANDIKHGETASLRVSAYDGYNGLNGTANVNIDGNTHAMDILNGEGFLELPEILSEGNHTFNVKFHEKDGNYEDSETNATIAVEAIKITIDSLNVTYGDYEEITITTDVEIPVNVTVTLNKINDSKLVSTTLKPGESQTIEINGTVDLNLGVLDAGKYRVTVSDVDGSNVINSTIFTVSKANTKDELNVDNPTFGDDITGNVIITGDHDEGVNGTAIVSIDDKDYNLTLVDGKGSFSIPNDLAAGEHLFSLTFNGNKNYNPTSDETSFTIERATPEMDIVPTVNGDSIELAIKMPEDVNKNVIINVDGVNHTVAVKNGEGKFTIPHISSGEHNTTITFPGNENYTSKQISLNFTIPKNGTDDGGNGTHKGDNAGKQIETLNENLAVERTGNPIALLLLVLLALPIRRILKN